MRLKKIGYIGIMVAVVGMSQAATLIDADWSGGTQTPGSDTFSKVDNGRAGGGTWDQETGVITPAVDTYTCVGMSSDTVVDFSAIGGDSLVLTAEVASRTGAINANGIFIGFQNGEGGDGTMLWNNNQPSFGLVISGGSYNGMWHVAPGGKGPDTGGDAHKNGFQATDFGITTADSVSNGFTVVMTINSNGWDFVITGLEDGTTNAIMGGSGIWADVDVDGVGINWEDLIASTSMHAAVSSQGNLGVLMLARVNVTQGTGGGEPVDPPVVVAIRHLGTTVEVDATNLVSSVEYQLVRSATLASGSITNVVDGPLTPDSDIKTFVDSAPLDGVAFYQVQTMPEPAQ